MRKKVWAERVVLWTRRLSAVTRLEMYMRWSEAVERLYEIKNA